MVIDAAEVSVTAEPSGEVRIRLHLPHKHGTKHRASLQRGTQAPGGRALVYRREVREKLKTRSGFGATPNETVFGRNGKRSVKNACGALEAQFGRKVVFATVTLPGSTATARLEIARWSAKIIELLSHWILSKSPGSHYVYVWERQRSGALHLHAAIGSQNVLELRALERGFKGYIHQLFSTITRLSGCDMFARGDGGSWKGNVQVLRSNCVPVRKSVKRYMAKYITKGVAAVQGWCPSRWWGCSRPLRALVWQLRRCIHRRISSWEQALQLMQKCKQAIDYTGYISYAFSPPFSPLSVTHLIYPPDIDVLPLYALIEGLISEIEESPKRVIARQCTGLPVLRFWDPTPRLAESIYP